MSAFVTFFSNTILWYKKAAVQSMTAGKMNTQLVVSERVALYSLNDACEDSHVIILSSRISSHLAHSSVFLFKAVFGPFVDTRIWHSPRSE